MDSMKFSPGDLGAAHADDTVNIEGYDQSIDAIRAKYPDETKTDEQQKLEDLFDPDSEINQGLLENLNTFDSELADNLQISEDINLENMPKLFDSNIGKEVSIEEQPTTNELGRYTEREEIGFNLNANGRQLDDREQDIAKRLRNYNLEETRDAFNEINADATLTEIFDTNGDGAFTYADMFDTHRWNNGKGITKEQDIEYTRRWLEAVDNKTFTARWSRFGQNLFANKTKFIADGRRARLAPIDDVFNMDDNVMAGVIESLGGTLNLPEAALHWASGGKFGTVEGKRFGDKYLGHKNPQSMMYLMATPAKRHWSDGMWHEVGYWGFEAAMLFATYGTTTKATAGKAMLKLPKGKRLAIAANKFFTINPTTKTATRTITKKGIVTTWSNPSSNLAKFKNLGLSFTKAGYLEVSKGAFTRDLNYATLVGLYNEDNFVKGIVDKYPDTWIFGSQMQMAIESPIGKRMSYYVDEASWDSAFAGGLFGIFRYGPKAGKQTLKWGWKTLEPMRTSISKFEWSASPFAQKNGKDFWKIRQQKSTDLTKAGEVQLSKNIDPSNPFNDGDSNIAQHNTQGRYKNIDSNANPGEGIVPTRSNPRQIINDMDEIDGAAFTKSGNTDAILDPTDLTIAARHGVNGPVYKKLTESFVTDETFAKQLQSLDPLKRNVGEYGEGTLKRIQEIISRDAGGEDFKNFWPKELTDMPLKIGNLKDLDEQWSYVAENIFVADAINSSLLTQLRNLAGATSEMIGKQDIFTVDGPMSRISNNLAAGIANVKQTRLRWTLLGERMREAGGFSPQLVKEVEGIVSSRLDDLHTEATDGVRLMFDMLKKSDSPELVEAVLDVFKVSNKIHNWKDFDAWMRQKISGGEFDGTVKTGALIQELQGVMVNSILSGPKTPLRAILGTASNSYLNAINEYVGAVIKSPFSDQTLAKKASFAKLKGMVELLPEAWTVFRESWNSKFEADFANIRTRYSEAPTRNDHNWNLFREWTEKNGTTGDKAALYLLNTARTLNNNKLFSWSPRALAATDDTFKWLMARARSKEVALRNVLEETGNDWNKLTPDLLKKAEDTHYRNLLDGDGNLDLTADSYLNKQFKEITLTSEFEGFSKKLDGILNETPLLKPFYLFARTGINGLNLSFKNTPLLGVLHKESIDILKHTGDDFRPLMRYGIENAHDLIQARNLIAGRQAVGATVVSAMSLMYMGGQLTGNGPADRELKQSWINGGWKPNHIYFGDVGFNYSSLEPFNIMFSAIADIGDNVELMGQEWAEKRLQAVMFVVGRGLTGKTYMSGLDQLMQMTQFKPGAWNKGVGNILNNSVPLAGLRNEFGKWINPHMKELNSDMWDSIRNRNQISEALTNKPLSVKHDILNGTPINNWNIIGRSFNAISPIQIDIRRSTPGRKFLIESGFDLKTSVYSYGGYSFAKNANVRSAFQQAMGEAPIEFDNRKFKNLEQALDYLSQREDIIISIKEMNKNRNNSAVYDVDQREYPHNTILNRLMDQAREKAWAKLNQPTHPAYSIVQQLKAEKDGHTVKTREVRNEILEIANPSPEWAK
tara:strand:- start:3612 stop:8258 length:4647 start_codon:yes stop_codon:yes gene_type:complete